MIQTGSACPIGGVKINNKQLRIVSILGFFALIVTWIIPLFSAVLLINYSLLSFLKTRKYAPFSPASKLIVRLLKLTPKMVDIKPKLFATRLGMFFSLGLFLAAIFNISLMFYIFYVMFLAAISLQSLFGYCLGCQMYTILIRLKIIKL